MDAAYYRTLFEYERWANREVLRSLKDEASEKALRLMAHLVATRWLWLERIEQVEQSYPVWPDWGIHECERRLEEIEDRWIRLVDGLDRANLQQEVTYVNTKGESWPTRVGDIVAHVLFHSAYHRGQIALSMRAAGSEPAYTDLVHAIREGRVSSLHTGA